LWGFSLFFEGLSTFFLLSVVFLLVRFGRCCMLGCFVSFLRFDLICNTMGEGKLFTTKGKW
jgi:hypothetical protein